MNTCLFIVVKGESLMVNTQVVLGTGPLGLSLARTLQEQDEDVRAVNRSGDAPLPEAVSVQQADLGDAGQAQDVCEGASTVYFCVQPPYTDWPALFPPLLDNTIDAAEETDARLVVADNCYMYGPTDRQLTEDLPYEATGRKGQTRAAMARTALEAHEAGRVDVTIGRASDFYGPHVTISSVGERVFATALAGKPISVLGNPDTLHTYTYIDDFAQALVTLGEHERAFGEAWHVPAAETITTREFVDLVRERAGTDSRLRPMPSWLFRAVSTFSGELKELRETMYIFEKPFVVDHSKFADAFGADPTPHEEAIDRTLEWYQSI